MVNKKKIGDIGENFAVEYLLNKGYKLIERNRRFKKGEIDIILKDKDEIVFVEVKTRTDTIFGPPEDALTPQKRKMLKHICQLYLERETDYKNYARIDVVSIILNKSLEVESIEHFMNAFT